jgi:hypothetical protein
LNNDDFGGPQRLNMVRRKHQSDKLLSIEQARANMAEYIRDLNGFLVEICSTLASTDRSRPCA